MAISNVETWFQDETRVGQQGSQTRIWAPRGTRPRIAKQQQYLSQYIFGAVCPERQDCAALVLPQVNHDGLQKHLKEISLRIPQGRHGVVIMDRAGWHTKKHLSLPDNISILFLPPRAPELNPQEMVWQYLKDKYLANRTFQSLEDIVDACCKAWNAFANAEGIIGSLTTRSWAQINCYLFLIKYV